MFRRLTRIIFLLFKLFVFLVSISFRIANKEVKAYLVIALFSLLCTTLGNQLTPVIHAHETEEFEHLTFSTYQRDNKSTIYILYGDGKKTFAVNPLNGNIVEIGEDLIFPELYLPYLEITNQRIFSQSELENITSPTQGYNLRYAILSPDGENAALLEISDNSISYNVWLVDLGSKQKQLIVNEKNAQFKDIPHPVGWSDTEQEIYFNTFNPELVVNVPSTLQVYNVNLKVWNTLALSPNELALFGVFLSPDQNKLAYVETEVGDSGAPFVLSSYDISTHTVTKLYQSNLNSIYNYGWITQTELESLQKDSTLRLQTLSDPGIMWPVAQPRKITSYNNENHNDGIDVAGTVAQTTPPIFASDTGKIQYSRCNWEDNNGSENYGCFVKIQHTNKYCTLYAHLNGPSTGPGTPILALNEGSQVSQGSQIGIMGTTGNSSGIHLHFEYRKPDSSTGACPKSYLFNPLDYLDKEPAQNSYVYGTVFSYDYSPAVGVKVTYRTESGIYLETTTGIDVRYNFNGYLPGEAIIKAINGEGTISDEKIIHMPEYGPTQAQDLYLIPFPGCYTTNSINTSTQEIGIQCSEQTPPTATWNSPANNSTITSQTVTLNANASDNSSGVDYVRFSAKFGGSWHNLYSDYTAPYNYTWDLCAASIPNGEIELGLQAYDKAGNEFVYSEHYANYKIYKNYNCDPSPSPTPSPSDVVKLYNQANYGGDPFWTGGAGNHGNINPLQFTYSMRVPNNWSVETFSDYNFGGQKQCWAGSVAKLGDYGWTSEVKSLKAYTSNVCPTPPPPGGQWQAKFWRTGTCYDDHSQCTSGNTTYQSQPSVPGNIGGKNYIIKEDWGQNSPGGSTPSDDWSGYFETTINFPAGNYVFYATHDDGLKLKIGNYGERSTSDERIDSDRLCNDQPYYLNGNTKVEAYLHERGGDATIQIWYDTNTAACVKPETPPLWWPDHQSTINDTTPAFDWLAISGGVEYRIQVADNTNFTNAAINTTTTATNYTPGTPLAYNTYYWRVQAKNGYNNWSNWSDIRQVTITPVSVPTIAATDGLYTDKVQITWNSVSGATGYEVYRADSYSGSKTKLATVSTTTYYDTSAVVDTVYYYWIKACNGSTCSNYSNYDTGWRSVSVSPPTNVQASDGSYTDKVRVTWNAVSGATGYEVWRYTADSSASATKIAALVTGTSYDDVTAALDQTYYYWVKAKNNAGTSGFSSSDVGYRHLPIPNQPGAPYEISVTSSSITFGWTDNAANETGFKLYKWSGAAVDFVYHDQVGANVTTYTDANLNCDSKYWYKVTAFNTYGESPQTGWLEAQTASCASSDSMAPTFPVNDPSTGSPLIKPAGGAVLNTPRPIFDWYDAVDNVGVAGYTLRITGGVQSTTLQTSSTDVNTTQSTYTPTFDLVDGTYTWTVQAYDAAGNRTSFVKSETFTIAPATGDEQKVYLPALTK